MPDKPGSRWRLYLAAAIALLAAAAWWSSSGEAGAGQSGAAAASGGPGAGGQAGTEGFFAAGAAQTAAARVGDPTPEQRQAELAAWKARLAQAEEQLTDYRRSTQYPNESRPISEHPDQVYPNQPVEESRPLHLGGGQVDPTVTIKTTQSRVYVAGD
jgi:hypothetical protein